MFNFFQSSSDPAVTPGSVNDMHVPGGPSPDRPAPSTYKPTETAPSHAPLPSAVLADTHTHDEDQNAVSATDPQLDLKDALAAEDGTSRAVDEASLYDSPTTMAADADLNRQPTVVVGTAPPKQSVAAAMAPAIPEFETPAAERSAPAPTAVDFDDSKPIVHPSADETAGSAKGDAVPTHSHNYGYVPADVPRHQLSDPPVQQDPKSILRSSSPAPTNNNNNTVYTHSPTRGSHSRDASIGKFSSMKRHSRAPSPAPGSVTSSGGAAARRARSVRSLNTNGEPINGSTFVDGAATAAPLEIDPTLHERQATAEGELTSKEKAKLEKQEAKHGRQLSVIIKQEGKAEKQALDVATKELAEVQKLQKVAIKDEGKAHTAHARALAEAHKAEMAFLAAQALHEKWQANLRSAEETLEASREHARRTTEMLREKNEEVEHLRATKQVDDRERLVKMKHLNGGEKSGISRIFGK